MSEGGERAPVLPPWVGKQGFITTEEWFAFDDGERAFWSRFAGDVSWLLDQPPFRRFSFTMLNETRFFGTDRSPMRATPEETAHAVGMQDGGRAYRLVLQTVAPRMWMKIMHDAFNDLNRSNVPPESGKR